MTGRRYLAVALLLLLLYLLKASALYRADDKQASYLLTKDNQRLGNRVFQIVMANSLASCVQLCLTKAKCKAINYYDTGLCELNDRAPDEFRDEGLFTPKADCIVAWWVNLQMQTYSFTSLDGTGASGPRHTDSYASTSLEGSVQLNNGIQIWTTPFTGSYIIEAVGASGANGTCSEDGCTGWTLGGKGARIKGTFFLRKGVHLKILVGQKGLHPRLSDKKNPGGGGGGTFVALSDDTPLVVAGGGGGGSIPKQSEKQDGDPGQVSTNGSRYGGYDGSGGRIYDTQKHTYSGSQVSTGAGFYKDGEANLAGPAKSFTNGGAGSSGTAEGGFGGGGCPVAGRPGGGGGFSGGGVAITSEGGMAGGGGSYNNGDDQNNIAGTNEGDGSVTITFVL